MKGGFMNDKELKDKLYLLSQGDYQAFEDIYNELKIPAFTVVYRMTHDIHLSEDIMQEVFIKLYYHPFDVERPRAYFFKMIYYQTVDSLRKIKRVEDIEEYSFIGKEDNYVYLDIEEALTYLKEEERNIIILHLNAGLKFKEISEILQMPLGTILWKYQKALKELKKLLNGG